MPVVSASAEIWYFMALSLPAPGEVKTIIEHGLMDIEHHDCRVPSIWGFEREIRTVAKCGGVVLGEKLLRCIYFMEYLVVYQL